jgi:predicted DCC family thiol-disulfide oxidoreductase YuxK
MNTRQVLQQTLATGDIVLIYDKECPACDNYCQWVNIHNSLIEGRQRQLLLIDARQHPEYVALITERKLDIDQGMVVLIDDQCYYGSDAIHVLALMSSRVGVFNRINHWLFSSKKRAYYLYPLLRSLRNILLKLLRKTKINNLHMTNNHHF